MRLQVNNKKEIIGYANLGDLADSIEFNGAIPDDFEDKFKPGFFMIKNSVIVDNPNYVAPADTPPDDAPTSVQEAINKLGETTAKMANDGNQIKTAINKLGLAVAELQTKEVK